jgi:hypothetical protein
MLEFFLSQTGLFLAIVGVLVYKLLTWNNDFFEKRNVKFIKPVPLFGNLFKITFQLESFFNLMQNICKDYAGHRLVAKISVNVISLNLPMHSFIISKVSKPKNTYITN